MNEAEKKAKRLIGEAVYWAALAGYTPTDIREDVDEAIAAALDDNRFLPPTEVRD